MGRLVAFQQGVADRAAHPFLQAQISEVQCRDALANAFSHFGRTLGRCFRQEERKLLPTDPADTILLPQGIGKRACHLLQHDIPGMVAEPVVDLLEVVDIQHHHRQRAGVTLAALEFGGQGMHEAAPVE